MSGSGAGSELEFITGMDNEETKTRTELEIHYPLEMLPNPGWREYRACRSERMAATPQRLGESGGDRGI